jgi:hypothetical protein
MDRLWVKLIKNHRMIKNTAMPCGWDEVEDVLTEVCREFDVSAPMWLSKHEFEFEQFRRTAFTQDHFIEEIRFDRMEIEMIDDEAPARRSRDIRNQFD